MTQQIKVFDWRKEENWRKRLALLAESLIFLEGNELPDLATVDRLAVEKTSDLVIYTPLSSPTEWIKIIQLAEPKNIYLLFLDLQHWDLTCFLESIWGMLKSRAKAGDLFFQMERIAAVFSVSIAIVKTGIDYLSSLGLLYYQKQSSYWEFTILNNNNIMRDDLYLKKKLYRLLIEREAFLRYQIEAKLSSLQKAINSWYQRKNMLK